jgi:hypothetical protein
MSPTARHYAFHHSLETLRGLGVGLCLGLILVLVTGPASAQDSPPARNSSLGHRPNGFGQFPANRPMIQKKSIEFGYLFVDGAYVELPYEVEIGNSEMRVNGTDITKCFPAGESSETDGFGRSRHRDGESRGPHSGGSRFAFRQAADTLTEDGIVILQTGEASILMVGDAADSFLNLMIDDEARQSASTLDLSWLPPTADQGKIAQWLETYQTPAPLRGRIEKQFADRQAARDLNISQKDAVRRLDQWGYPLSVLGMVLVVAAIGHLLSRRPEPQTTGDKVNLTPDAIRQTNYSLMLVAAMSGMDLVWTILISQAGVMKELNPLGSRLLSNPGQLILFKMAMTALALCLIFGLRRYRRAQMVSWWGCLLFTILTVRWLTFNSLFV